MSGMTAPVRQLPEGVINQIAAGEVVERPASVLKELLENAVDAGSSRIEAAVSGPFPFTIAVTDDGCGMTVEDLDLAVRRHTTSKILSADDLQRIATYGFRGEALPSIAAVSRLRIVSRPPGSPLGQEIIVEGGETRLFREAGARSGTTVEVSGLFGSVPARRKFLKSPRTELARLWEVFHAVGIPREGILHRMSDGRTEFAYEPNETSLERAARHAGEEGKYLAPLRAGSPFFRLTGWAGLPQVSRAAGTGLHFFVNGRYFRDRGLMAAVREAYRGILPEGRLPLLYLFIACDPSEVDVNVHPAKTEARFRYGRELFELVRHAVGEALGGKAPRRPENVIPFPAGGGETAHRIIPRPPEGRIEPLFPEPPIVLPPPGAGESPLPGRRFSALKPVGQMLGTYVVCEGPGEVVIIDQHAADERIVFSRLKDAYLGQSAPLQHWLVPQEVTLSGCAAEERGMIAEFLERAGFSFEPLGESAFRLTGGPAILGRFDVQGWWKDFRDFLESQESAPKGIFDADRELWRMACHAAARAGDPLPFEGLNLFLRELDRAVGAHSCPHGRPVWVKISGTEMERLFGRS
ncbi:MAG: DNA mismatch repair endonuclease MutL [Deltaproteobacteria bacterium]|nr:DNA mismatch repair endonuclease MutL [Deltaproteobacteria bacterium]